MKITLATIVNAQESIKNLSSEKFPIGLSYQLNRIISKLLPEFELIENCKKDLFQKYGKMDEKNNVLQVIPEKFKDLDDEFTEFLKQEIDLNIEKINIEIKKYPDIKLSVKDLATLNFFIDFIE